MWDTEWEPLRGHSFREVPTILQPFPSGTPTNRGLGECKGNTLPPTLPMVLIGGKKEKPLCNPPYRTKPSSWEGHFQIVAVTPHPASERELCVIQLLPHSLHHLVRPPITIMLDDNRVTVRDRFWGEAQRETRTIEVSDESAPNNTFRGSATMAH